MYKKLSLLFLVVCLSVFSASASHYRGGEITWKCLGSGQFVFKMKLYRDCSSSTQFVNPAITVYNNPNISLIALSQISVNDQSDVCGFNCASGSNYAVEEDIYQSAPITLTGVPPAQGWIFTFSSTARTCNDNIQNTCPSSSSQVGFTLRAMMYNYGGQNTNTCYDSSPDFSEVPKSTLCAGAPFTFNHNANDADLDSLNYSFANPLEEITGGTFSPTNPPSIIWQAPYSTNSPLPGSPSIDAATGDISFNSSTTGNFTTVIKVASYRCNQKIAEVFREIQVILYPCGSGVNNYPVITPPFTNPITLLPTYNYTVYAGTLINFNLNSVDDPTQQVTILPSGNEFGANFTDSTSGCLKPPCATLSPAPSATGLTGTGTVQTQFRWQTSCSHLNVSASVNCNTLAVNQGTYTFLFKVKDNFCPVAATSYGTIRITVLGTPLAFSPELRCASVNSNGSVTLSWDKALDPDTTFNKYVIFRSPTNFGPFNIIDSVANINTLSYTDNSINAQTQSYYYFVKTRSGCYGQVYSPPVDTLRTMKVNVTDPSNGTAILNWNALRVPNLATSTHVYKIYKKLGPGGAWTQIGTTTATTYTDTITNCGDSLYYEVSIGDAIGCTSMSSIGNGYFSDLISPTVPIIDSVSVNLGTGFANIGWTASPSADVNQYIVYYFNGTSFTTLDTVSTTQFIDNANTFANSNPDDASQFYQIAALDSCGNVSLITNYQSTIFLQTHLDNCNDEIKLTWAAYAGWPDGVLKYLVYQSKNGMPYQYIGTSTGTSFTHSGLVKGNNYCYYVRAISGNGGKTAASNTTCKFSRVPDQPNFIYLTHVTVTDENKIEVKCFTDTSADVMSYKFSRAEAENTPFNYQGSAASSSIPYAIYEDTDVATDSISYNYKVTVLDSCGNESITSNIGKSILLKVSSTIDLKNTLTWSEYKDWPNGVARYDIYRAVDGKDGAKKVTSVYGNMLTYVDVVTEFPKTTGKFCYYVIAYENGPNTFGISDSSKSNFVCTLQEPTLYIPNAFHPSGGINTIFIPVSMYVNRNDYEFVIYNRWGDVVFKTHNPEEGWDGKKGGDWCPEDVYTYVVRFKNDQQLQVEKRGIVTMIR